MDEADTWLFKGQDKWAKTASLSPIHQGALENSTWHEDSTVLLNNLQFDPIVPQWGRQATAHSRVIDWINSLIPNRWIEYWCLVRPDHKRKTQSASTAQRFNPQCTFKLQSPVLCPRISSGLPTNIVRCGFYHHSRTFSPSGKFFSERLQTSEDV